MLEKGATISYGACGLPYFIEGRVRQAENLIVYTPEYFRKERNITVRTGAEVVAIQHARREVQLRDGRARALRPAGHRDRRASRAHLPEKPNEFTLHTLEDGRRLKQFLRGTPPPPRRSDRRRLYRPGSGRRAAPQRTAGSRLRPQSEFLHRDDEALTAAVRKHLEHFRYRTAHRVADGVRDGADAGDPGAGHPSRTWNWPPKPAWSAGAPAPSAWTSACRRTSPVSSPRAIAPRPSHLVTGCPAYVPLGTTANKMGRVAGANAAGARERFPGIVGTISSVSAGWPSAVTGPLRGAGPRRGFRPGVARIDALDRPTILPGQAHHRGTGSRPQHRPAAGRRYLGEEGVAGRLNVIATALHNAMRVEDFECWTSAMPRRSPRFGIRC